jgi:Secretion system C-terminal sorting domain
MVKKIITVFTFLLMFSEITYSQIIFSENFESVTYPNLPTGWTTTSLDVNGGFYTGSGDSARLGGFWLVKDHTSFAMSNDDVCLCDESDDFLISPSINLSAYLGSTIFLEFDAWMEDFWQGIGMVKVDTGTGWIDVYTIDPTPEWQNRVVNLSQFAGASNVMVAFHYNDEGTSGLGLAIDDVSVYVPVNQFDGVIYSTENTYSNYTQLPYSQLTPIQLSSTVYNNGTDTLFGVNLVAQSAQTGYTDSVYLGVLPPAQYASLGFVNDWIISATSANAYGVVFTLSHNNIDDFLSDNTELSVIQVSDSTMAKEDGSIGDLQIPLSGETVAQTFRVFQKDTITSFSLYLLLADPSDSIEFNVYTMQGGFPDSIIYTSEIFTSLTTGWMDYYLSNEIALDTGNYALAVRKLGPGLTGVMASNNNYVPRTTFITHYFFVDYFWYYDEQGYAGSPGYHHTYLFRPNFGNESIITVVDNNMKVHNQQIVYPNPTNGLINILSDKTIEKIGVYNVSGKLVYEKLMQNNKQLNLSFLDKGIYFMRIKLPSEWVSTKIIINK